MGAAQDYPTKPITIIIPFGPGGHSDLVTRPLTTVSQKYLGQPLVVKMMPGGQGIIGTEAVAKSPADGYTLLAAGAGWNSALPALEGRSKGPDDLEPVALLGKGSTLMAVRADSPHKTLKDLVAFIKANPGKVTIGIGGPYTTSETFWRWMIKTHGINVRLVKFGGGSQMMLAGLGGHVDVFGGSRACRSRSSSGPASSGRSPTTARSAIPSTRTCRPRRRRASTSCSRSGTALPRRRARRRLRSTSSRMRSARCSRIRTSRRRWPSTASRSRSWAQTSSRSSGARTTSSSSA